MQGHEDLQISGLSLDSRKIEKDYIFFALKGEVFDGHDFIEAAILNGASVVIGQKDIKLDHPYIMVNDPKEALATIADAFFESPSSKVQLVGITGTNGKTTVSTLLYNLCMRKGIGVGLISTIDYRINDSIFPSTHTTPDIIRLNELLSKMADANCKYVFMEVSSHAIDQGRIEGLEFSVGLFTNITHDHLDYHGSFRNYLDTKKQFFDTLSEDAIAIVNNDDKHGRYMLQNCKSVTKTVALKTVADYKGRLLSNDLYGLHMKINEVELFFKLTGRFNAYNLLSVYAVADSLDIVEEQELVVLMSSLEPIEGRMQLVPVKSKSAIAVVDYAHTPDAVKNILESIGEVKKNKVVTIIGCGGDRDRAKRPIMAKIAVQKSDLVILTSDNPRNEDPESIIEEMEGGLDMEEKKKVLKVVDREQAIKIGIQMLSKDDVLLVAGKGHEKYQEVKGVKSPFDDKEKILTHSQ